MSFFSVTKHVAFNMVDVGTHVTVKIFGYLLIPMASLESSDILRNRNKQNPVGRFHFKNKAEEKRFKN